MINTRLERVFLWPDLGSDIMEHENEKEKYRDLLPGNRKGVKNA